MKTTMKMMIAMAVMTFFMAFNAFAMSQSETQFAYQVFNSLNTERENAGLAPLAWASGMAPATEVRAQEASVSLSHIRPDNTEWYTADPDRFYGENLAVAFTEAGALVKAWMESPTHRENVMGDFETGSVAVYTAADGCMYVAAEFGYKN